MSETFASFSAGVLENRCFEPHEGITDWRWCSDDAP
jgi:hypothetical protein